MGLPSDNINTTASDVLQEGPGPYLTAVQVVPIFWGSAWADSSKPNPTWLDVTTAIINLMSGPYMDGLNQYGGIQPGSVKIVSGTRYSNTEPPNPFTDDKIHTFISDLFQAGLLPDPSTGQFLYVVFMPPGVSWTPGGLSGDHSPFQLNGVQAYCAWIGHGDLDGITTTFSHELAEACSDPGNGSGIVIEGSEIADWCGSYTAKLNGVEVQAYWSLSDHACIIPTVSLSATGRSWPVGTVTLSDAGFSASGLAVARNADGTLEAFGRGQADAAIWHIRQNPAPGFGFTYQAWNSLGGETMLASHCAIANADGRIEVFAVGTDGAVWHNFQNVANADPTNWSGWNSLGGTVIGPPCVARNANGTLEVFACGTNNALWHISQTSALDWGSNWNSLGGQILTGGLAVIPAICVGTNADGRLEAFVRGLDGAVYHNAQNQPNAVSGNWAGWHALGKAQQVVQIAVARNADGRLELFAIGTDGALWHISQTPAPDWGAAWNSLHGTVLGLLTVGTNLDGRLEVFVRGNDYGWWHIWQTAPNAGPSGWSAFLEGDLPVDALAVASNVDGRLELFAVGRSNGLLYHAWQMAPSNGWNW